MYINIIFSFKYFKKRYLLMSSVIIFPFLDSVSLGEPRAISSQGSSELVRANVESVAIRRLHVFVCFSQDAH